MTIVPAGSSAATLEPTRLHGIAVVSWKGRSRLRAPDSFGSRPARCADATCHSELVPQRRPADSGGQSVSQLSFRAEATAWAALGRADEHMSASGHVFGP